MSVWRSWWGDVGRGARAPSFWDGPAHRPSGAATLLTPLSWIFDAATRLRWAMANPMRASVPVICVGNLVAGGAGKTPTALAIAARLRDQAPHFLIRGYRGKSAALVRVDPARHTARDVGDEALLLAAQAPTWASPDRRAAARAAIAAGAKVLVMDDGFQNPRLAKDVSFVVIDQGYGFGNGRLLPAGPLRESPGQGFARANAVVLVEDAAGEPVPVDTAGLPSLAAHLEPTPESAERLKGARVLAFAGIGRPEKFFQSLRDLQCDVVATRGFPDHHAYSDGELVTLRADALTTGARLVTTTKDRARLSPKSREGLEVLEVEMIFSDPGALDAILAPALEQ